MISVIKHSQEKTTLINLFNVDYNAKEEDIRELYEDVNIISVDIPKAGIFLLELDNEQAIKLVEIGTKAVNGRPFFMKIGFAHKKQHPDEQWHQVNASSHKYDLGQREDRPKRGGFQQSYNRREQTGELNEGHFPNQKKPYQKDYQKDYQNRPFNRNEQTQEPPQIDPENKFFKGHDLTAKEFNIKFTKSNSSTKKDEETAEGQQPKPSKSNPFGAAVPRDEKEYLKKKEEESSKKEEKSQVKDLQDHFEEKKERFQSEQKDTSTPVNSPNAEFVVTAEKKEGDKKAENEGEKAQESGPPGIFHGKGQKKPPTFVNQSKNKPQGKANDEKTVPTQPKEADKSKKSKESRKANVFGALEDETE